MSSSARGTGAHVLVKISIFEWFHNVFYVDYEDHLPQIRLIIASRQMVYMLRSHKQKSVVTAIPFNTSDDSCHRVLKINFNLHRSLTYAELHNVLVGLSQVPIIKRGPRAMRVVFHVYKMQ